VIFVILFVIIDVVMTKFSYKFYLDIRKPLLSGLYSIKIYLYDSESKKVSNFTIKKTGGIEVSATKEDFAKIWTNRHRLDSFGDVVGETTIYGNRMALRVILKEKQNMLDEIISRDSIFTNEQVKKAFYNYVKPKEFTNDVYKAFQEKIEKLENLNRYKTAITYRTTLNNIQSFNSELGKFRFEDLTKDWIEAYDNQRRNENKVSALALDMKNIRHIYNIAKEENDVLRKLYPFGQNKYNIPTTKGKNVSLSKEDIDKIINLETDNLYIQRARDFWVFSYLNRGMNLKDIAYLKKGDVDFVRKKTQFTSNKVVKVKLTKHKLLDEIVKRNKGTGKYMFDIIDDNDNAELIRKKIDNQLSRNDKQLKKLAGILQLPKNFSFTWARHSYTTNVYRANVNLKAISESLGHTSLKTTENYIDSLQDENQQNINDALGI